MDQLVALNAFVQTSETGSFVAAARQLGLTASAIGKAVARLEEQLQVRLFHRNTRNMALTEEGRMVNGRGDDPNQHDILTGSNLDGTVYTGEGSDACSNWTSNSEGSTRVGHFDRTGGGQNPTSWNSAHDSRGCSQEDLIGTGGNGYFFCFAVREE